MRTGTYKFLIVDDDPDDHDFISMAIRNVFPDAKIMYMFDGVELTGARFSDDEKPDVILLDLNMGVVGGKAVLMYLRRDNDFKNTPVIILTTAAETESREKYQGLGANDLFKKPYELGEMTRIIREIAGVWI